MHVIKAKIPPTKILDRIIGEASITRINQTKHIRHGEKPMRIAKYREIYSTTLCAAQIDPSIYGNRGWIMNSVYLRIFSLMAAPPQHLPKVS
jgi:hypothetical protein